MVRMTTLAAISLAATVIVPAAARPVAAVVACGSNITSDDVMTTDLVCATDPAVTVTGANLDMAGHRLESSVGTGVALAGTGAKLYNGFVDNCITNGVTLGGNGGHTVQYVFVRDSVAEGFLVQSSGNKLVDTRAVNNAIGYSVTAAGNKLLRNTASAGSSHRFSVVADEVTLTENVARGGTAGAGFLVTGNNHKLSRNNSVASGQNGFEVTGNENKLTGNVAARDQGTAFVIAGEGNKLSKNQALAPSLGDGFDLTGNGNKLMKNHAVRSGADGFKVATGSTDNSFSGCTAVDCGGAGFRIDGTGHKIQKCQSIGNDSQGIRMDGQDCTISSNRALGNVINDVDDNNVDCDSNSWSSNVFGTEAAASAACTQ